MEIKPIKILSKNFRKNYNVCVSVSLFKMDDPYRDFGKYVAYFFRWIYSIPKDYFVRLYTDEITLKCKEFEKILKSNINHLEIFLYDYPEFKNVNGYHDGTFGSITRFLALFDSNLRKNVDYVWISDIDVPTYYFDKTYINTMKKRKADICYMSKSLYIRPWILDNIDYPLVNTKIIVTKNVKISKTLYDNFLKDILNKKYEKDYEQIIEWDKYRKKSVIGQNDKLFIYGFDEIYSNQILYKEMIKYKRLIVYHISLAFFNYIRKVKLELPNYDLINQITENVQKGDNSRILELLELNNKVYEYLSTKDLTFLGKRYEKALEDYKKYHKLINSKNKEFAVYLLVNP